MNNQWLLRFYTFLLITFLFFINNLQAQSVDTTWTRLLEKEKVTKINDISVALNPTTHFVTAGRATKRVLSGSINQFDLFGNIQWQTIVHNPNSDTFLVFDKVISDVQSSTYWALGDQIIRMDSAEFVNKDYIARFDSSGTLLDTAVVEGSNRFISDGVVANGELYFTGGINPKDSVNETDIWFGRFNKTEGITWSTTIDNDSIPFKAGRHILKTSDGFLIGGAFRHSDTSVVYLTELNKSGDILWEQEYQFEEHYSTSLHELVRAGDTGYLLMGLTLDNISDISTGYLIRVGSQGDLRWKKVIEDIDTHSIPNRTTFDDGIYQAEDSTFIVGGSITHYPTIYADKQNLSNTGSDVYLLSITSDGKHNWQYTIKQEGNQYIRTLYSVPSADTNRILAGGENGRFGYLLSVEYSNNTDTKTGSNPSIVKSFQLSQNYPNPFNPTTTIKYSLPEATKVKLNVYNLLGQQVVELVNTRKKAGTYSVTFDAGQLSSGVYIYKLQTKSFGKSRKMLLVK